MHIVTEPEKIPIDRWKNYVRNHPNGNFFHDPDTYSFFYDLDGYKPFFIAAIDDNTIVGLLCGIVIHNKSIMGFFSRRAIIWGGPLIINNDPYLAAILIKALDNIISRRVIYTEFRNLFDLTKYTKSFLGLNYHYYPHLNIRVLTQNENDLLKKISKSKMRQIKSSLKHGAYIKEAQDINDVVQFYILLKSLYRNKIRKPLPDFSFFESFFNNKQLGKYFMIEWNNRIIGGIMCPIFNNKIIYEWYITGLDSDFSNIYPSVFATWAPIQYALTNGLEYFDFMGAGSPNSEFGVREFKSKFGGMVVEYGRYLKINKPILYTLGEIGLKIFQIFKIL